MPRKSFIWKPYESHMKAIWKPWFASYETWWKPLISDGHRARRFGQTSVLPRRVTMPRQLRCWKVGRCHADLTPPFAYHSTHQKQWWLFKTMFWLILICDWICAFYLFFEVGRIVGSAVPIVSEHLWKYDQSHVSGLYHIISCYIPTHGDLFHPPVVVYGGWPTCFGFHHVKRRLRGPRGGARRPHRQSASGAAGGRGSDGEREDSYMAGQKCWWHRE